MTSGRKTVVFGLDGACFDLIQPWLDRGALPTLQGLIDAGGRSGLRSCVPATTPPAWTSLTTGVNPGKHGVFGFYAREKSEYAVTPVSDTDVQARRLWDYLSTDEFASLVVNVPVTHPARETEGVLVPGYLAPDRTSTYPRDVLAEVGMDDYRVYAPSEADDVPDDQLLTEWLDLTSSRRDLGLALMDRFEWDLLFLEFQKTDGAVHKFDDRTKVRRIFERVDACLADVLDAVDGDPNVFVVSDHGIGQPKEWAVALNTWLVDRGYATTERVGAAESPVDGERDSWLDRAMGDPDSPKADGDPESETDPLAGLLGYLGRAGLTKQRIERLLSSVGLYEYVVDVVPEGTGNALGREVIDRRASTAFYEAMGFSGVDVGVILNDDRFYGTGTVTGEEYDRVREELVAELRELTGPDESRPFSTVRPREEVYSGPRTEYAPDIVLEQAPDYVIGSSSPRGQPFIPTDPGRVDHTRTGLLVAAGPDVEPDWTPTSTPSITDVTPTLLALLGVPLAESFDGRPMTELLAGEPSPTWREYDPYEPPSGTEPTADEEAALEERLRGMGYLE